MPVSRCFRQGTDQSRRTATPSHGHKKPDRGYVYYNAPIRPGGTAPARLARSDPAYGMDSALPISS